MAKRSTGDNNATGAGTKKRPRSGYFTSNASSSSSKKSEKNKKSSPASAAAPNPTEFVTGGVRIKFPFQPYKSQKDMMSKIVDALQRQENALLESPTGSGKSLALLCGALAWLESEKAAKLAQRRANLDIAPKSDVVVESPYFTDTITPNETLFNNQRNNTIMPGGCGSGCGSSSSPGGGCGSRSNSGGGGRTGTMAANSATVLKEPFLEATTNTDVTSAVNIKKEAEEEGEDDDDNNNNKEEDDMFEDDGDVPKSVREKVEIKYEDTDIYTLGTVEAERSKKALAPDEAYTALPKIYFGSRTHKQITQLVKELKSNTGYRPKMVVLGGRNHYCINPTLKNENVDKNDACQELLDNDACFMKHGADRLTKEMIHDKRGQPRIWDMEDLIRKGEKQNGCPYFAARSLTLSAELIFCPYNYLIDPNIRKAMEINLDNSIVILDEAHNIEGTARDAAGLEVGDEDLKQANREFGDMIKYSVLENTCRKLMDLSTMFVHILEEQTTFKIQNYEESTELWTTVDLLRSLERFGLNRHSIVTYRTACDEMAKALKDKKELKKKKGPLSPEVRNLTEVEQDIRMNVNTSPRTMRLMEGIVTVMDRLFKCNPMDLDDYKIALVESLDRGRPQDVVELSGDEGKKKPKRKTWNASRQGNGAKKKKEMLFWCLNPGVIFRPISTRARSVILTSGTLSPLDSFASELQTTFAITLEADHVVDQSHVWAGVIPIGPTGVRMDGTYKSISTFGFQDELGRTIEQVITTTPHGVLCFVSSYATIDNLMNRWQQTGQYDRLSAIKKVILEPRKATNEQFDKVLNSYYSTIADHVGKGTDGGALLFAVYRGKCSEGIDFTDANCRAVLAVSIPFPSLADLKIKIKKEYNDARSVRRPMQYIQQSGPDLRPMSLLDTDLQRINHSLGSSDVTQFRSGSFGQQHQQSYQPPILLSGKRWYEIQAFRAYNQAIGRCIRHRKDWGSMVLLDYRFTQLNHRQSLSKWARPLTKTFSVFEDAISDMKNWITPLLEASKLEAASHESSSASASFSSSSAAQIGEMIDIGVPALFDVVTDEPGPFNEPNSSITMSTNEVEVKLEPSSQVATADMWMIDTVGERSADATPLVHPAELDLFPLVLPADQSLTPDGGEQNSIVQAPLAPKQEPFIPELINPPDSTTVDSAVVDDNMDGFSDTVWLTPPEDVVNPDATVIAKEETFHEDGNESDDFDITIDDINVLQEDEDVYMVQSQESMSIVAPAQAPRLSHSAHDDQRAPSAAPINRVEFTDKNGIQESHSVHMEVESEIAAAGTRHRTGEEYADLQASYATHAGSPPTFDRTPSLTTMMDAWQGTGAPQLPLSVSEASGSRSGAATQPQPTVQVQQQPTVNYGPGVVRIQCKTCEELLLVCSSRPKIKTVHKSMAQELMRNLRRLAGTDQQQTGTHSTQQYPNLMPSQFYTSTQANPTSGSLGNVQQPRSFQRSSSSSSLTGSGGESPKAMVLVVRGIEVLDLPFDGLGVGRRTQIDEYECIFRPQDRLCYRRIMCPKCSRSSSGSINTSNCEGTEGGPTSSSTLSSSSSSSSATASMQERNAVDGWKGVIVVTTGMVTATTGLQGSEDALEHGSIWLAPAAIRIV
ncbi:Fanconi anemia group J protein [Podila humilis]|nr:Fanconi anemia group J protein [Podila humilis]